MTTPSFLNLVSRELDQVMERMLCELRVDDAMLSQVLVYPLQARGKGLRPTIALLAARASGDPVPDKLITLAAAMELLHTATLVHDDVVDAAPLRRGYPTLSQLRGTRLAVLVGDYLFAQSAFLAAQTENQRIMRVFSQVLVAIGRAESEQFSQGLSHQPTEVDYYRCIQGKTAALFSAAAESGAILAGAPESLAINLRDYGLNLGMAFQIVDDILDFVGDERELGKPGGNDLRHGTLTLPAIYFLEEHPQEEAIRRVVQRQATPEQVQLVVEQIRHSTAIERAYATAAEFAAKAKVALDTVPESQYRQALADLADYVTERRR